MGHPPIFFFAAEARLHPFKVALNAEYASEIQINSSILSMMRLDA
jgi:hypothetical protein